MANARFIGRVVTDWLDQPRKMKLINKVSFIDNDGVRWEAPENSIVDGASIPRLFWRFIGSPFVGKYRRASVIHDVYCVTQSKPHKQVHKMFYNAMRCDGVGRFKAKAMYLAVKIGGPTW